MVNFNILNTENLSDREYADTMDGVMPDLPTEDKPKQAVQVIDPFDPAPVVAMFKKFVVEIDKMDAVALAHEVKDDASCELATTYTTQAKALDQTIEKKRKKVKKPYFVLTSTLDGFCKKLSDRLKGTQIIFNNKIRPYLQKKEADRLKAAKEAQAKADKEQKRLDDIAAAEADRLAEEARQKALKEKKSKEEAEAAAAEATALAEPAPVVVAEIPEEVRVKTETGTADIKKEWAWEITDFKALPDAAFETRKDEVTKALSPYLNAQVKAGIREITGLKIYQTTKLSTRTRR